jgi:hypothetical protein
MSQMMAFNELAWIVKKRPGSEADHSSNQCRGQANVDVNIHYSIRLNGAVLN